MLVESIADNRRGASRERRSGHHGFALGFARADLEDAGFEITHEANPFVMRKRDDTPMWLFVGRRPW